MTDGESWVVPYTEFKPQVRGMTHHDWMRREWRRERERSTAYIRASKGEDGRRAASHAAGVRRPLQSPRTAL